MTKNKVFPQQAGYLAKIVVVLLVLGGLIGGGVLLKTCDLAPTAYLTALALIVAALLGVFVFVRFAVGHMDELQQAMHEKVSATALLLAVAAAAVVGVLQANDVIPLFNQLWSFAFFVAIWAIGLTLMDSKFK